MMNHKIGYVYLLDENCRIRWAGSGPAEEGELDALNNGVRKLIEERKVSLNSKQPADLLDQEASGSDSQKRRVVVF